MVEVQALDMLEVMYLMFVVELVAVTILLELRKAVVVSRPIKN